MNGADVTPSLFDNDDGKPFLGRLFSAEEYAGNPIMVLLSHSAWQHRFHSDTAKTIGNTVRLDGKDYIIVGVMSPAFDTPTNAEFLLPKPYLRN